MKITKARLKQIIKEELLKEADFSALQAKLLKHIKDNPGTSLKGAVPELDGEELTGAIQNLLRNKKITDKGTSGAKYYPMEEDLSENLPPDPSLSDKQKQVDDLIMRDGGLIDLIYDMESSAPSMLDTYRMLIKAIVASGIRAQALI
jgi:hypothetical protein